MRVRTRPGLGSSGLLATGLFLVAAGLAVASPGAAGVGLAASAAPRSALTVADGPAPALGLWAEDVPARTRIAVTVTDFQPRSSATVTETYRDARNGIVISKTVALGRIRLSRDGTATRSVTPVQAARTGTLTVTGVDRAGTPVTVSRRIRVG